MPKTAVAREQYSKAKMPDEAKGKRRPCWLCGPRAHRPSLRTGAIGGAAGVDTARLERLAAPAIATPSVDARLADR